MVGYVFLAEAVGRFFFPLARVLFDPSGQSSFQAIFKTSDTEVNLLHVFSGRVSRDAKMIKEGGPGKRHASAASIPSREEGEKTKQHSRNS